MIAVMTGQKRELTLKNLLWHTLRFPFVTLQSDNTYPLARTMVVVEKSAVP